MQKHNFAAILQILLGRNQTYPSIKLRSRLGEEVLDGRHPDRRPLSPPRCRLGGGPGCRWRAVGQVCTEHYVLLNTLKMSGSYSFR